MSLDSHPDTFPDFIKKLHLINLTTWGDFPTKSAAVLVLFVRVEQEWELLLTRRSKHVTHHRGQIGFPGGMRELQDLSPAATALREYEEELGAPGDRVHILGCLNTERNIDRLHVIPVVAISLDPGAFFPAEAEVAEVLMTRVLELKNHRAFEFNVFGQWRESDLFQTATAPIWGLTARILKGAGFPDIL